MLRKGVVALLMVMLLMFGMVGAASAVETEELVQMTVEEWYFYAAEILGGTDGICESTGPHIAKLAMPQMHDQTVVYVPKSVAIEFCKSNDYVAFGFFSENPRFVFANYVVNNYNVMVFSDRELYRAIAGEARDLQRIYGQKRVVDQAAQLKDQGYTVINPANPAFNADKTVVDLIKCQTTGGEIYIPFCIDSKNNRWVQVSDPDITWAKEFSHGVVDSGEIFLPFGNVVLVDGERAANRDLSIRDTLIKNLKDVTIFNQF